MSLAAQKWTCDSCCAADYTHCVLSEESDVSFISGVKENRPWLPFVPPRVVDQVAQLERIGLREAEVVHLLES